MNLRILNLEELLRAAEPRYRDGILYLATNPELECLVLFENIEAHQIDLKLLVSVGAKSKYKRLEDAQNIHLNEMDATGYLKCIPGVHRRPPPTNVEILGDFFYYLQTKSPSDELFMASNLEPIQDYLNRVIDEDTHSTTSARGDTPLNNLEDKDAGYTEQEYSSFS